MSCHPSDDHICLFIIHYDMLFLFIFFFWKKQRKDFQHCSDHYDYIHITKKKKEKENVTWIEVFTGKKSDLIHLFDDERFEVDVGIIKPRGRTKYVVILPLPLTKIGPRHSHG